MKNDEMSLESDEAFLGQKTGQIKASQIRGAPNYPVEHLYPCNLTEGIQWQLHPDYGLSVGVMVNLSGCISFAPVMIHRMRMKSFRVHLKMDSFEEEADYRFTLYYYDKNEKIHAQESKPFAATRDIFTFDIPLDHVRPEGVFACSLRIDLLSPLEGAARKAAMECGSEYPCHPLLLRAQWLEIKG